jgi:hypothetical protein
VFTRVGAGDEAIDAFVLTLRFFVMNNEPTSIANIEKLFVGLPIDARRIEAVKDSRATFNAHLDPPSNIAVKGERLIRRDIFEVFLWGGLAHSNVEKKEIYDSWMARADLAAAVSAEFSALLVETLQTINWFRNACTEAANILEGRVADSGPAA